MLSSTPAFQGGVAAPSSHFQGKFAAPNVVAARFCYSLCGTLSFQCHCPLIRQTVHFPAAKMMKGYHMLFQKKKKPNFYNHGFRVHFMLIFLLVREAYVAKDMVRETKTRATMSLIIWNITDCLEPTNQHNSYSCMDVVKHGLPTNILLSVSACGVRTDQCIDQLSTAVSGLLKQGKITV